MGGRLIRNVSATMQGANLCTKQANGFPCVLRLVPGEVSREVSEEEFRSAELQKLLSLKVFVDVTGFAERQRQARAALGNQPK